VRRHDLEAVAGLGGVFEEDLEDPGHLGSDVEVVHATSVCQLHRGLMPRRGRADAHLCGRVGSDWNWPRPLHRTESDRRVFLAALRIGERMPGALQPMRSALYGLRTLIRPS